MNLKLKTYIKNYCLSYLLTVAAIFFLLNKGTYTFLDFIDLLIHEPGHLFFGIFGEFIQFLGGTLMQIFLPLIMAILFFIRKQKYWTQLFLFWLGHNFINISVYVEDANKMELRIIGGAHDWNWILNKTNLIQFSEEISLFFIFLSILSFLVMFFIPYFLNNYDDLVP